MANMSVNQRTQFDRVDLSVPDHRRPRPLARPLVDLHRDRRR